MSLRRARCAVAALAAVSALSMHRPDALAAQSRAVDFATALPASPAQAFLGAAPTQVQTPGNLRDFGAALLSAVGEEGRAEEGFALDASVWNLIPGFDVPLADYRTNRLKYALANLQLSLATVRSGGADGDLRAAFGLKAVLLDQGDPLLSDDVTRRLAAGLAGCRPAQPGAGQSIACVDSVTADVIGEYTTARWNATQLSAAVAWGTRFPQAELGRGTYGGLDAWLLGAYGLGTRLQLIGQGVYKSRERADTVPQYQALNLGARLVAGSATFNAFGELAREWRSTSDQPGAVALDSDLGGWSAGVELRIAANTWLATGLGTRFDALATADRVVVIANIRWGVTSAARMDRMGN